MSASSTSHLEHMLAAAMPPWVMGLGLAVEAAGEAGVRLRLPASPGVCREGGLISGQALAALADTSMVAALWADLGEHRPVATVDLHVTYLRAARDCDVIAEAEVVRRGRALAFARVSLASSVSRQVVATAIATFALPS